MSIKRISSTPEQSWADGQVESTAIAQNGRNLRIVETKGSAFKGFGGCFNELGWQAMQALREPDRATILDLLFKPGHALGFTVGRLPMGASDYALEWHSYDETDGDYDLEHFSIQRDREYLLPFVKEALKRSPGMTLFASPWSPPTWLKFPKAYNYGTIRWERRVLETYAAYFLKYVQAYAAEGVEIAQVHVQNEPVADQKFPSCLWTGAQLRDFIRDYLGPTIKTKSPQTEVWLGTINAPFHNYVLEGLSEDGLTQGYDQYTGLVLDDAAARKYISGVGYQWGGKNAIERTHDSWPSMRLMQTENECGDGKNTWDYAHYCFNLIRHYCKHGVEAYCYWNMVLAEGGTSTWGWKQNSLVSVDIETKSYRLNPEFHLFRHFSQFVKPGAVFCRVEGNLASNTCAFENPDGSRVLVVANPYPYARTLSFEHDGKGYAIQMAARAFETVVLPAVR